MFDPGAVRGRNGTNSEQLAKCQAEKFDTSGDVVFLRAVSPQEPLDRSMKWRDVG
jgi:hypothetical protein